MNEVIEAINSRRSIRSYIDRPVPEEIVNQLLEAAVMSPSAMNRQPWKFVVIQDRKKIKHLSEKVKKQMGLLGYALNMAERIRSEKDTIFYGAPLLVIVTGDAEDKWSDIDCGIIAQTMFLAAYSLGLGSCYIGFANTLNNDPETLKELGIPKDQRIIAPLIFGYTEEKKPSPKRDVRILTWMKHPQ